MRVIFSFLFVMVTMALSAQLPQTDLLLFKFNQIENKISSPKCLNGFNSKAYNNQPAFFSNGLIYYVAQTTDSEDTDIIALDLNTRSYWQVTQTSKSEYSPQLCPNPRFFSVVLQDKESDTQTLWRYPMDQSKPGEALISNVPSIGYYSWIDRSSVAVWSMNEAKEAQLSLYSLADDSNEIIMDKVGRCIKTDKKGNIYFTHKVSDEFWYIKSYDPSTQKLQLICQTLEGAEDFERLADGSILMAKGSALYRYNPDAKNWEQIRDLADLAINKITRIASQRDQLILVVEK